MRLKPQHGGHNKGQISPRVAGSGPVFEIRTHKNVNLTQGEFAAATGLSRSAIQQCEREGDYPKSLLAQRAVLNFARERDAMPSNIL